MQAELRELELQASNIQHLIDHGNEDEMDSNGGDDEEDNEEGILGVGNLSLAWGSLESVSYSACN